MLSIQLLRLYISYYMGIVYFQKQDINTCAVQLAKTQTFRYNSIPMHPLSGLVFALGYTFHLDVACFVSFKLWKIFNWKSRPLCLGWLIFSADPIPEQDARKTSVASEKTRIFAQWGFSCQLGLLASFPRMKQPTVPNF